MISDEMLRQAAHEARCALLASLPEPQEYDYTFSREFEIKMSRLLRKMRHPVAHRVLSRVASILLTILLTAATWLSVDTRAREAVFHWFREVYESIFIYRSGHIPINEDPSSYRPTKLPENWVEIESWTDESGFTIVYSDSGAGLFYFNATLPSGNALAIYEGREGIQTNVNGQLATYYLPTDAGGNGVLVWEDPDNHILFSLFATNPMEDLVEIAESIGQVVIQYRRAKVDRGRRKYFLPVHFCRSITL